MTDFLDALTPNARVQWYILLHEMGLAYKAKDKRHMVEVNYALENIEDVAKIMTLKPGEDKSECS